MKKAKVKIIKVEQIDEGTRGRQEYTNIQELGLSMLMHGVIQPLAVAETDEKDKYFLLAGGRRLRAAKFVGIKELPVRIYEKGLSKRKKKVIELEENLQREDLTYEEKCMLTKEIHDTYTLLARESEKFGGHTFKDTAELLGVSQATVTKDIQMAKMIAVVPELGKLKTQNDAVKMVRKFSDKMDVKKIAEEIQKEQAKTPLAKQKRALMDAYLIVDFFKGVKSIPDNSIDFADVDPDWGIDFKTNKEGVSDTADDYHEIPIEDFDVFASKVIAELWRVMKEGSWGVFWHGSEWTNALQKKLDLQGFRCNVVPAIWIKDKGSNRNPDLKLSKGYEQFLYFRKGQATLSSTRLGRSTNFDYKQVPQGNKVHPTEKPIELMEEILETFVGGSRGTVLIPFAGGGNTMLACANKGHIPFGFDLSQPFKNGYILKVNRSNPGEYKSHK